MKRFSFHSYWRLGSTYIKNTFSEILLSSDHRRRWFSFWWKWSLLRSTRWRCELKNDFDSTHFSHLWLISSVRIVYELHQKSSVERRSKYFRFQRQCRYHKRSKWNESIIWKYSFDTGKTMNECWAQTNTMKKKRFICTKSTICFFFFSFHRCFSRQKPT